MCDQAAKARDMLEAAVGVQFSEPVKVMWNDSAVWAFTSWIHDDVEVSFAGKLTRRTLREIFAYAFDTLGCTRVTAHVGSWNPRMAMLMERIGFTLEGTKRRAFFDSDVLLYGMLKQECKYHDKRNRPCNRNRCEPSIEESAETSSSA